ncbi:Hypothetical protein, predicted lipoprotein [Metamycoplasma auris 15026]|uniref:Lipoprotein n=1 Tax=Metamycoplasma auris 15026 TaxID=1188233 RepID=N9VC82_9BACT|nr:hypothetical protein [Metamycoplasma auris]ENY69288.1 Hypothetical protein, predicted lipoprotein [Metamycoplasma auris 15026]
MKKSLALLLSATTIATITTPILAISCGEKESKQKKEFKAEIAKLEAELKTESKLKLQQKEALEKLLADAKKKDKTLKKPEDFKKALAELKKKIEEVHNDTSGNQTNPTPTPNNSGVTKTSSWDAIFNDSPTGYDIKNRYMHPTYEQDQEGIFGLQGSLRKLLNIFLEKREQADHVSNEKEKSYASVRDLKIKNAKEEYEEYKKKIDEKAKILKKLKSIILSEFKDIQDENELIIEDFEETKTFLNEAKEEYEEDTKDIGIYNAKLVKSKELENKIEKDKKELLNKKNLLKVLNFDNLKEELKTQNEYYESSFKEINETLNKLKEENFYLHATKKDIENRIHSSSFIGDFSNDKFYEYEFWLEKRIKSNINDINLFTKTKMNLEKEKTTKLNKLENHVGWAIEKKIDILEKAIQENEKEKVMIDKYLLDKNTAITNSKKDVERLEKELKELTKYKEVISKKIEEYNKKFIKINEDEKIITIMLEKIEEETNKIINEAIANYEKIEKEEDAKLAKVNKQVSSLMDNIQDAKDGLKKMKNW